MDGIMSYSATTAFEIPLTTATANTAQKRQQRITGGYRCQATGCSVKCDRSCDLRKHHQRKHLPEASRPLGCAFCDRRYSDRKDLNRHINSRHKDGTPLLRQPQRLRQSTDLTQTRAFDKSPVRELGPAFKRKDHPEMFFKVGQVFRAVLHERLSSSRESRNRGVDALGRQVMCRTRTCIVVEEPDSYCLAVTTTSGENQDFDETATDLEEHTLAFTNDTDISVPPREKRAHGMISRRFRVAYNDKQLSGLQLETSSRVDYAKLRFVQHYSEVELLGNVTSESLPTLLRGYSDVRSRAIEPVPSNPGLSPP